MVEKHTFSMVMLAFGCVMTLVTLVYVLRRAFNRDTGEVGGWELRGARGRIGAVARTTLAEGVRDKLASGFAVLILVGLPFFWFTAEGDGTVKGRVQMFMTYCMGFSGFVLCLLTIFFSCRSLSFEVASRQIYSIVSKPIPRWQILAGKWIGIMVLNAVLLGIVGAATYGGTVAIVRQFKNHLRHALETDGALSPQQAADVVAALDQVRGIGKEGIESPIVDTFARTLGRTPEQIAEMLLRLPEATRMDLRRFDALRRQVLVARAVVVPEIPDLTEAVDRRFELLKKEQRLPVNWSVRKIREEIKKAAMGEFCTVPAGLLRKPWVFKGPPPKKGRAFILSLRFKLRASSFVPAVQFAGRTLEEQTLWGMWGIGDPTKPTYVERIDAFALDTTNEIEIPTQSIADDGTLLVCFGNLDPRSVDAVIELPGNLEVLYHVGSFGQNIFRGVLAMLIPLACLASFGVCGSTFLSFPVGSLIVVTLFIITSSMGFVAESLAVTDEYVPPHLQDFQFEVRRTVVDVLGWVLAIGDCDPVAKLREGRVVGWPTLWENFWKFVLVKSGAVMAMGVLVFRRRELAAVIV